MSNGYGVYGQGGNIHEDWGAQGIERAELPGDRVPGPPDPVPGPRIHGHTVGEWGLVGNLPAPELPAPPPGDPPPAQLFSNDPGNGQPNTPWISVDSAGNLYVYGALVAASSSSTISPSGDTSGTTDTTAIQNALTAASAGGKVTLAAGTFYIKTALAMNSFTHLTGAQQGATILQNVGSASIFNMDNNVSLIDRIEIDHISMVATGAHIFTGGWLNRSSVHDCSMRQNSVGFSIWNANVASPKVFLENRFYNNLEQTFGTPPRTVEAWFLTCNGNNINMNSWRDNAVFNNGTGSVFDTAKYWYRITSTGSNNTGNAFTNITFEHPFGGAIWFEGGNRTQLQNCMCWDIPSGSGTISNSLIKFTKNATGSASTRNIIIGGPRNQSGVTFSAGVGDIECDSNTSDLVMMGISASGDLKLYLNGAKGMRFVGQPDSGWGIQDSNSSAAAGSAAGAGAPAPVASDGPSTSSGSVTFGTGTGSAAGQLATVTFGNPFETTPTVLLLPRNANAAALLPYAANPTSTGFDIDVQAAPADGQVASFYGVRWYAISD